MEMLDRKATVCLLAVAATLIATVSVALQTRTLAITRVNVVDVVDGRIVPNSTVVISDEAVTSVTQDSAPPAGAHVNVELWEPCSGGDEYRPEACRPFFDMLARRGVWQTPTLAAMSELMTIGTAASQVSSDRLAYASRSVRRMWAGNQGAFATPELIRILRARAEVGAVVTSDMAKAGVGILAGCDTMIAGFCVHDELAAMVRGGMSPLAALQTATINPARYFGLQQTAGTVASGRRADLVLLDANPLTDITNVRRIRAVVVAGRLLDRQELDKVLAQVRIAAGQQ